MDEKLAELEKRIEHLENETGTSHEQRQFELLVAEITPDGASTDVKTDHFGKFVRITNIDGDDAQQIMDRVDRMDEYDYALTETGEGLGVEVWNE